MIATRQVTALMKKLEKRHGPFTLFALLAYSTGWGKWDLTVAAPWIERKWGDAVRELVGELRTTFGNEEWRESFSGIRTLSPHDDALHRILEQAGTVNNRVVKLFGYELFDMPVTKAQIFRARPIKAATVSAAAAQVQRTKKAAAASGGRRRRQSRPQPRVSAASPRRQVSA